MGAGRIPGQHGGFAWLDRDRDNVLSRAEVVGDASTSFDSFGTLDETFELLTLVQTGRAVPAPIVFLDPPDKPFWKPIMAGLMPTLLAHSVISPEDTGLYRITGSVEEAASVINGFYANYHSLRHVDGLLVLRMEREIPDPDLDVLRSGFAHLCGKGSIEKSGPTRAESRDDDHLDRAGKQQLLRRDEFERDLVGFGHGSLPAAEGNRLDQAASAAILRAFSTASSMVPTM